MIPVMDIPNEDEDEAEANEGTPKVDEGLAVLDVVIFD